MSYTKEVIEQFDTPFFSYDLDGFEKHIQSIKSTLHPEVKIFYACKANPLSEILRILNRHGFGVDVASMGELAQAHKAQVHSIIATGPAKSRKYLEGLLDGGVSTIVIESPNQLALLDSIARERNIIPSVLLRVQLDWTQDTKSVLGGSSITPFGVGALDWQKINLKEYTHLNIKGLHCFQWGNILDLFQLKMVWESTIKECLALSRHLGIELQVLDLGGGLGVSYNCDKKLAWNEIHTLLLDFKEQYKLKEIWLELGRFSIAEFGTYHTKIIDIKSVRGKNIIVTEGGINHLARPALVGETFPCSAIKKSHAPLETYSVHGPLCTALDYSGDFQFADDLAPGDWLQFNKTGAYGFTESMPFFLCHDLPMEVYTYQGKLHVPRPPRSVSEWMV
jgi:diaminopimelate decarboxylase